MSDTSLQFHEWQFVDVAENQAVRSVEKPNAAIDLQSAEEGRDGIVLQSGRAAVAEDLTAVVNYFGKGIRSREAEAFFKAAFQLKLGGVVCR